jgi:dihydrodipicolinate synthase/N-acetylneuraminate lyase
MHAGFYVPIVIPMLTNGCIDYASLDHHLAGLMQQGASGIMLHRSYSELDYLAPDELDLLCRYVQSFCAGQCSVILDIGADTVEGNLARLAYAVEHSMDQVYLPLHEHSNYTAYVIAEMISQMYIGDIIIGIDQASSHCPFPVLRKITNLPNVIALATHIDDIHIAWYFTRKLPGLRYLVHDHIHTPGGRTPHSQPWICNPIANIAPEVITNMLRCLHQDNPQAAQHLLRPYSQCFGHVDEGVDTYLFKVVLYQQGVIAKPVGCRSVQSTPWLERYIAKQLTTLSPPALLESSYA